MADYLAVRDKLTLEEVADMVELILVQNENERRAHAHAEASANKGNRWQK